jgi:RHS repeat-associated protein
MEYVNDDDNPLALYYHGEDVDRLKVIWRQGEGVFWALTDQIGSVRRVLDHTGAEVAALTYDSYGNPLSATGTKPDAAGRFAFAGREWDPNTGLYYNRARYYDPDLGRFISEDPLVFGGDDPNLYRYALNNPVRYTDPNGTVSALEYVALTAPVLPNPVSSGQLRGRSSRPVEAPVLVKRRWPVWREPRPEGEAPSKTSPRAPSQGARQGRRGRWSGLASRLSVCRLKRRL